jgi:hypothetical protein
MEDAILSFGSMPDAATDFTPDTGNAAAPVNEPDKRAAPRFTLLVRAVKLVSAQGEFVCVLRDVSETGASIRLFHELPHEQRLELHMPGGGVHPVERVWQRELESTAGEQGQLREAGLRFVEKVEVAQLIHEASEFPRRGLRLGVCFAVRLASLTQRGQGMVVNLSQQGARIECDGLFAIDQNLRIEADETLREFPEVRAKVRWRRGSEYGVVFDDTLNLARFARLAARLQAPGLLSE